MQWIHPRKVLILLEKLQIIFTVSGHKQIQLQGKSDSDLSYIYLLGKQLYEWRFHINKPIQEQYEIKK